MATNASPSCWARVSASASTRARPPEIPGWLTEEPWAEGSLVMAPRAAASTTAGSAPAAVSSGATGFSGTSSSACSRCTGSALGLPLVRAVRIAADTASRLRVVNFSVSIGIAFS